MRESAGALRNHGPGDVWPEVWKMLTAKQKKEAKLDWEQREGQIRAAWAKRGLTLEAHRILIEPGNVLLPRGITIAPFVFGAGGGSICFCLQGHSDARAEQNP